MRPRSALALLLPSVGTLLLLLLAPPARPADKPTPAELKDKVKGLVEQLADKDPDKQDEAAAGLLKLGPDVLPLLPKPGAKLGDAQKKALAVVREALRDEQIKRDLSPKLVTLDDELPVSKALAELKKQTGVEVEDKREAADTKIKLKLTKVTFWEALDAIAREADGKVDYFRGLALVARPPGYVNPPVSYNGIFRATIRRITAQRLLEAEGSNYVADVEVVWEPRFTPFRLELTASEMTVQDDKGRKVAVADTDKEGDEPRKDSRAINSRVFTLFDVQLGSLDRSSSRLGLLKLPVKFVGPTRFETFTFEKTLAEIKKDPKLGEMSRDGVTVKVKALELPKDHWSLVMGLEFPAGGPEFESFESWLIYNEMSLKNAGNGKTFPNNGGYVIDSAAGNRAVVEYHFLDSRKDGLARGEPGDWKPVYKVPGLIVDVPATFEFKDVPLP